VPRLNIRGPLAAGLAALLLFFAAASGAAIIRLGDLAALAGGALFETSLTPVVSSRSGTAARVHVRVGADVQAGDRIVTLDTAALDRRIAALKAQADTAKRQLALVRLDVTAPAATLAADRPVLASLEQRTGELEQEAQWLLARIAVAEDELASSEIRAPVAGRVVALSMLGPRAPIDPEVTLAEIATNDRSLLDRLLEPLLRNLRHRPRS
jgi:multidrug resistance efflux pump